MRRLQELFPRLTDEEVLPPLLSLQYEDPHHIPMSDNLRSHPQQRVPSLGMSVCLPVSGGPYVGSSMVVLKYGVLR